MYDSADLLSVFLVGLVVGAGLLLSILIRAARKAMQQ
jgi:hypothetical protein